MPYSRLSRLFAEQPESVLQELVNMAVEFCGVDSAGISLEEPEHGTFRWIVVSGSAAQYLGGRLLGTIVLAEHVSTWKRQLHQVTKRYYDHLGVTAEPISDGMLIPWCNEFMSATLWAVSHDPKKPSRSRILSYSTVWPITLQSSCVIGITKACCESERAKPQRRWRIVGASASIIRC